MSFERWMARLGAALAPETESEDTRDALERVTATLLVEIARADHDVDDTERAAIRDALARSTKLPAAELEALIDTALADSTASVSLHAHVRRVNEALDKPGRIALVEQMWRVALADGDIDGYEEYTIRKLADLLYVKHRDFMKAKLRVLDDAAAS